VKYSVITFGCRVNQADSLGFEEALLAGGAVASSPADADLVVVNSCTVTATADQGTRQTIRRIARDNPSARIVVTGCYATRSPEEVAALPNVERVIVNDDKPRLIQLLRRPEKTAEDAEHAEENVFSAIIAPSAVFSDGYGPCGAAIEPGIAGRTAFTLRVQTGCDEPCSYCIIPTTRGAPRSVRLEKIVHEVERVTAAGFKEIALTGVHLGSYGRDLEPRSSLIELLDALDSGSARLQPDRDPLPRTDGLLARDRGSRRVIQSLCAALSPAAPARERPRPGGHAAALHDRLLRVPRRPHPRENSERLNRLGHHRRLSGRNRQ
jgi:threonylcarbamoyladenosine tRNA methylthiotransferase MtaB